MSQENLPEEEEGRPRRGRRQESQERGAEMAQENVNIQGRGQYLIAARRGRGAAIAGIQPMSAGVLRSVVSNLERLGAEVVSVKQPRRALTTLSAVGEARDVYVVRMDEEQAQVARQTAGPQLIVERNALLRYGAASNVLNAPPPLGALWGLPPGMAQQQIRIRVVGEDDEPLANVFVQLQGIGLTPSEGLTNANGEVTLELIVMSGDPAQYLFINPQKDYWNRFTYYPTLSIDQVNQIRLQSLRETISGFPDRIRFGWGQSLMGLDQLPEEFTGVSASGEQTKVGVIDSGTDKQHSQLQHIQIGVDLTNNFDSDSWSNDVVGHGTHCTGVIAALSSPGMAPQGFAPGVETHILKIFPGGAYSQLLDALDYCIENEIDVVNMSLGGSEVSEVVEQALEEAAERGVACIVAAGNDGGPVLYPASSQHVLAVSALGRVGEFPQNSWESQQILQNLLDPQSGLFFPRFTCFGPQIKVCAPGVSVISTVPPENGFGAQSGTSMAAPHVTGLAALLLAHLPEFQRGATFGAKNSLRVGRLFQRIQELSTPLSFGPGAVHWTGVGLPTLHSVIQEMQLAAQPQPGSGFAPQSGVTSAQPTQSLEAQLGRFLLHQLSQQLLNQLSQQSRWPNL